MELVNSSWRRRLSAAELPEEQRNAPVTVTGDGGVPLYRLNYTATGTWLNEIVTSATIFPIEPFVYANNSSTVIPLGGYYTSRAWADTREPSETVAERQRVYLERVRAQEERQREASRRRETASARAKALLYRFLSPEQIESYEDAHRGYFVIIGSCGTPFRIGCNGWEGNIKVMSPRFPRREMASVCAHADGNVPVYDHHLAQMLALQTDEQEFMRLAHTITGPEMSYVDGRIFDMFTDGADRVAEIERGNQIRVDQEDAFREARDALARDVIAREAGLRAIRRIFR